MIKRAIQLGLVSLSLSTATALAGPVDLSGWIAEGGSSSWVLQAGNDGVLQTVNGNPTVFYDPTVTSTQGTALNGNIEVVNAGDDDFIGFVLGYDSGEITGASTDFFVVDWKQGNQSFSDWGFGAAGLAISHVEDASDFDTFWGKGNGAGNTGSVTEIARGATLGSTGWADLTSYAFNIVFTDSLIEVSVDGSVELSITPDDAGLASFTDGGFGFYNFSQAQVLYSSIAQTDCSVTPSAPECVSIPEPENLVLLGAGLAILGLMRRRKLRA